MKSHKTIRKMTTLAMFLALSVVLHYLESLIPVIIPIPGVKLGLANTMTLLVLYFYDRKSYISIGFLRVLIVGLLSTGLFTSGFYLSLGGWFLSTLVVILLSYTKIFSIFGFSISSALTHGTGQVIVAAILYSNVYMLSYLPFLIVSGIITGVLIALISILAIKQIEKSKLIFN